MSHLAFGLRTGLANLQEQLRLTLASMVSYQAGGGGLHDGLECEACPSYPPGNRPGTN